MKNHVNKKVAEGLKEIGFDLPVFCSYRYGDLLVSPELENRNVFDKICSAPDFLTAFDWMGEKGFADFIPMYDSTTIIADKRSQVFRGLDHRNDALLATIEIQKTKVK